MIPVPFDLGVDGSPALRTWMTTVSRRIPSGGTVTLVAGEATVTNPILRADSVVSVTRVVSGGTVGHLTAVRASGSLAITSSSATDTSTLCWMAF